MTDLPSSYALLRDHPLFICGHPKSGTSLVRAVFDSHPQLIVYPEETIFFRRYLPQAAGLDLPAQLALAERLLIHIFRWNSANPIQDQEGYPDRDYSAIPFEEVRQRMREIAAQTYRHPGDILSAAVLAFGEVSGQVAVQAQPTGDQDIRWWVEKSPYNEYYADQIFDWWPQARCVHILRDPRDNFASYSRKHPDWSPEFFAANWNRSTQAGKDNLTRYGEQRYRILRYEDLVSDPEKHLHTLAEFLDIDWDASLTAPTRAGEQWSGNSMFANRFEEISAAPVARWKEKLSQTDSAVIQLTSRPLLAEHGYPLAAPNIAARLRVFTWPIRRRLLRIQKPQR